MHAVRQALRIRARGAMQGGGRAGSVLISALRAGERFAEALAAIVGMRVTYQEVTGKTDKQLPLL
jgi:hypothetical protein